MTKKQKIAELNALIEKEVAYTDNKNSVKNFVEDNYDAIKAIISGKKK